MNDLRTYCQKNFHLNQYLDDYLKKLQKLLEADEGAEKYKGCYLKKEVEGLCHILERNGYSCKGKEGRIQSISERYMKKEMDAICFESHPLKMLTFQQEIENQYRLVDIMHRNFDGFEALQAGDYGCHIRYGRPERTVKVEKVLAEYFHTEAAALVRGGGSGAIRALCFALMGKDSRVLVHDAPIYKTSELTLRGLGANIFKTDFNDFDNVRRYLEQGIDVIYIQRVRQKLTDHYDTIELIENIRKIDRKVRIIVDENYAVNKVEKLGAQAGADASTFSTFKLMGIPGIGLIVGKKKLIDIIHEQNYSGGGQVQGPEASEVLRSLVINPAMLAIQDLSVDQITQRLNNGEVRHVAKALKANLEERIVLVKLDLPIAREVIEEAIKLGALPHPVGSESRYEVQALFYRVAKVMLDENPIFEKYVIRINPMRSGPDTVIRILDEAIKKVLKRH